MSNQFKFARVQVELTLRVPWEASQTEVDQRVDNFCEDVALKERDVYDMRAPARARIYQYASELRR